MNAPPQSPVPSLPARIFGVIVRVLLMAAIILAGLMLLGTYRELFAPRPEPIEEDDHQTLALELWQPGNWSFGDLPWTMKRRDGIPADEVEKAFIAHAPAPASTSPRSDLEGEVLAWLRQVGKVVPGKERIYELSLQSTRLRAFIQREGKSERLALMRIGWPASEDVWTMIEIAPAPGNTPRGKLHLLPLGRQGQSLARRWGSTDRPSAEVVKPTKSFADLLSFWKSEGWNAATSRDPETGIEGVELRDGERGVQAWNLPVPGRDGGVVLLINLGRLPQGGTK